MPGLQLGGVGNGHLGMYKPILGRPWLRLDPSPYPALAGGALLGLPVGFIMFVWGGVGVGLGSRFAVLIAVLSLWISDLMREGTMCGLHSEGPTASLTLAVLLFIISETLLFFSFFWAWAHSAWSPSIMLGGKWPPTGISAVSPIGLPLFNLVTLV